MKLSYSHANQAWLFTFGDALVEMDGEYFFYSEADAIAAAKRKGLTVDPKTRFVRLLPK